MNKFSTKVLFALAMAYLILGSNALADVKISTISQPSATAKLRVFVVAVTTETKSTNRPVFWKVSPEESSELTKRAINEKLKQQGIYEVVPSEDVRAAIGNQTISSWEWMARDWALAKDVGKALHADYVMLFERSAKIHLQFDIKLINLNAGKEFFVSNYVRSATLHQMNNDERKQAGTEAIRISYRQLFTDAKSDLLLTAILKGKRATKQSSTPVGVGLTPEKTQQPKGQQPQKVEVLPSEVQPAAVTPDKPEKTSEAVIQRVKTDTLKDSLAESKAREKQLAFEKELQGAIAVKDKKSDSPRLVVYDFDAEERMKVVGLILTEALREELHNLGGFMLVNRENILKIMDEYKLQQTSLIDEKQAVKVGKWLAANEAITGNLAIMGSTSILQVKRVDIKTLSTMSLGSLKCPAGQEDELLNNMAELARKLVRFQKK